MNNIINHSLLVVLAISLVSCEADAATPFVRTDAAYAEESSWVTCHEKQCTQWRQSDHARAMDHANENTVLGDFSQVRFVHVGFDDLLEFDDTAIQTLVASVEIAQPDSMRFYSGNSRLDIAVYNTKGRKFQPPVEPRFHDFALACFDAKDGVKEKLRRNMTGQQLREFDEETQFRNALRVNRPCDITEAQDRIVNWLRKLIDENKIPHEKVPDNCTEFRMFRKDGKFLFATDLGEHEVLFTLGIRPLQQYLVETDGGRLQCLPVAWDSLRHRWFHLYPKEQISVTDPLHWSKPLQNWNYMCADCHTTALEKNFDTKTLTYKTNFVQKNVGCQSCHGPCGKHDATARKHNFTASWKDDVPLETDRLSHLDAAESLSSCASCHTRRRVIRAGTKPPAEPCLDYFVPEMPDRPIYYPDGQLLEEAFEIGSFMQSKMYSKGVSCANCHDPHSLELKYEGNRLCTQCHSPSIYDTVRHHFHDDATKPGTQCVECHFPQSTYMLVDPRRDHSIRKPNPKLTKHLGVPNSCTLCHHDRKKGETVDWAAEHVDRWYENARKSLVGHSETFPVERHYGVAIELGRRGDPKAKDLLSEVIRNKTDREHRDIIRASAVALFVPFANSGPDAEKLLSDALEDRSPLVQLAAMDAFTQFPDGVKIKYLRSKLSDPLLAIRIESARILAGASNSLKDETDKKTFAGAAKNFIESCNATNDRGASYLNHAVFEYDLQNVKRREVQAWFQGTVRNLSRQQQGPEEAVRIRNDYMRRLTIKPLALYQQSVRVEPDFVPSRINLAMLHNERGETKEAEQQFRDVLKIDPKNGDAAYSLGLLLAETGRPEDAVRELRTAIRLRPENARIRYNLALLLMQNDKRKEAAEELLAALKMEPENVDFLYALAVLHLQNREQIQATRIIERLIQLEPENPQWLNLKNISEPRP